VTFRNLLPILRNGAGLASVVAALDEAAVAAAAPNGPAGGRPPPAAVTHVAGIEARGFPLAAAVAAARGVGFVAIRKGGKIPGPVVTASFASEYGAGVLEVDARAFGDGGGDDDDLGGEGGRTTARVLVLDDVLATGGTAVAAVTAVRAAGAAVVAVGVMAELLGLGGRARVEAEAGVPVFALMTYDA